MVIAILCNASLWSFHHISPLNSGNVACKNEGYTFLCHLNERQITKIEATVQENKYNSVLARKKHALTFRLQIQTLPPPAKFGAKRLIAFTTLVPYLNFLLTSDTKDQATCLFG